MTYNKPIFPYFIHIIIYLLSAILFAYSVGFSMLDDGLRHIAFAAYPDIMHSWGSVYPHSLFNAYDQWFFWHFMLASLLKVVSIEYVHVIVNALVLFSMMLIIEQYLLRYIKYDFKSLIFIIVFSITLFTPMRYLYLRPDLLSGLYVMMALLLGKNKFLPIFLLTLVYAPSYYLFFLYTGSIGLVYIVQKKFFSLLGVFTASLLILFFYLSLDMTNYLQTIIQVLSDQKLREGLSVTEGDPLFSFLSHINYYLLLGSFFMIISLLIYKKYAYFSKNTLALFLLITSILWVNQYRYFEIFAPIIFIYIFSSLLNSNKKVLFYTLKKYYLLTKKIFQQSKNNKLFYFISIPYSIWAFYLAFATYNHDSELEKRAFLKDPMFFNKTILSSTMKIDMFYASYLNPSVKLIPSCSIGWFENNRTMKDLYINMQNNIGISEKELRQLMDYVDADFYLHYPNKAKKQFNFQELQHNGIMPIKIINNRILFTRAKNED